MDSVMRMIIERGSRCRPAPSTTSVSVLRSQRRGCRAAVDEPMRGGARAEEKTGSIELSELVKTHARGPTKVQASSTKCGHQERPRALAAGSGPLPPRVGARARGQSGRSRASSPRGGEVRALVHRVAGATRMRRGGTSVCRASPSDGCIPHTKCTKCRLSLADDLKGGYLDY